MEITFFVLFMISVTSKCCTTKHYLICISPTAAHALTWYSCMKFNKNAMF